MLMGVESVAPFITVNEQSESSKDYSFHASFASFGFGRSHHQNVSTVSSATLLLKQIT